MLFENGWRLTAALEDVSDTDYFQDLGRGPQVTSRTHVERRLQADYVGDIWRITARIQNFRTLDLGIPEDERPYARLPQVIASGLWLERTARARLATEDRGSRISRGMSAPRAGAHRAGAGISLPLEAPGILPDAEREHAHGAVPARQPRGRRGRFSRAMLRRS
jgi:LPS-assembly protein